MEKLRLFCLLALLASFCLLALLASGLNCTNTEGEDRHFCGAIQTPSGILSKQPAFPAEGRDQAEAWAKALPLVPLHVPKNGGTALLLKLLADKRVCNFANAQEAVVFIASIERSIPAGHGFDQLVHESEVSFLTSMRHSLQQFCPGVDIGAAQAAVHFGIGSQFDRISGRLMTMVRNPQERLVSNYWYLKGLGNIPQEMSLRDFAQRSSGCFVRMLTRDDPNACLNPNATSTTLAEALRAQDRLFSGFSFIGMQEQWDLSMCLFQKKFGGQCTEVDFQRIRATQKQGHVAGERWSVSELDGFTDKWDTALFNYAQGIFEEELRRYNVNHESCAACFAHKLK